MSKVGRQGSLVLQHRIFRHADIVVSLAEVGRHLGLTRERVRLAESAIMKMFKRAIWREEYRGCRFRFRPEFVQPMHQLADAIQALPPGALSLERWHALLREIWDVDAVDLGQQEVMFFERLGLDHELMRDSPIVARQGDADVLRRVMIEMKALFLRRTREALSATEVHQELSTILGEQTPAFDVISDLLESLPEIEREKGSGRYRLRLEKLKNHVDRCERILRDSGVPMHFREIALAIDRQLPPTANRLAPRPLASRMANAPRFVPIGKSGVWTLREWSHIETRTVAEIAAEILRDLGAPLTEKELFQRIGPLRDVRQASIGTLMSEDGRFRRAAPATWELIPPL